MERLDVSTNKLKDIPAEISALKGLQHFNLSHNALTSLPQNLFDGMRILVDLNVGHNLLNAFPSLTAAVSLARLDIK